MEKLEPKLRFPEFKEDWENNLLGDIAIFLKGKNISKNDIDDNGQFECIRYGELYTDYGEVINEIKSKTNLPKEQLVFSQFNDIIIPASGETQLDIATASCVLKNDVALGGDLNIIRTKSNGIFIAYYLNEKKKKDIASLAQGNSVVHLYSKQLKGLFLNIPQKEEQTKIATFLTKIDARINQLTKKKTLLEHYKKGVMQKIFSQELRFKDEDGNYFADWEVKTLGEVGEIITGKTPSTGDLDLWDGKIQFVTPTDIDGNKYQVSSQRSIKEQSKTKVLPIKSIMFTCIASIGKMSLSIKPCVTNQQINSIIPVDKFNNEFIYYALLNIVDYIKSTQSTNTLPIINKTEFSKFKINIPKSKEEQSKIANFLSAIDDKINQVDGQLTKTKAFKKGLLQQMFV